MSNRESSRFAALLRDMSGDELAAEIKRPQRLLLDHDAGTTASASTLHTGRMVR